MFFVFFVVKIFCCGFYPRSRMVFVCGAERGRGLFLVAGEDAREPAGLIGFPRSRVFRRLPLFLWRTSSAIQKVFRLRRRLLSGQRARRRIAGGVYSIIPGCFFQLSPLNFLEPVIIISCMIWVVKKRYRQNSL